MPKEKGGTPLKKRFGSATNAEILSAAQKMVPAGTIASCSTWSKVWKAWCQEKERKNAVDFEKLSAREFNKVLAVFIKEVRTNEGDKYASAFLTTGVSALIAQWNTANGDDVNFWKSSLFSLSRNVLSSEVAENQKTQFKPKQKAIGFTTQGLFQ